MKSYYFVKIKIVRVLSILSIILLLINSVVLYSFYSSSSEVDQTNNSQLINQAINSTSESSCTKVNFKHLTESFSDNFYSYVYSINKQANYPKIFIIISETDSEHNIRLSSFLSSRNTTST